MTMKRRVFILHADGTKVKLAAQIGRYESIGHDIVNRCIGDILVQGARPLFFFDDIASSKLGPKMIASVVKGMAEVDLAESSVRSKQIAAARSITPA